MWLENAESWVRDGEIFISWPYMVLSLRNIERFMGLLGLDIMTKNFGLGFRSSKFTKNMHNTNNGNNSNVFLPFIECLLYVRLYVKKCFTYTN